MEVVEELLRSRPLVDELWCRESKEEEEAAEVKEARELIEEESGSRLDLPEERDWEEVIGKPSDKEVRGTAVELNDGFDGWIGAL